MGVTGDTRQALRAVLDTIPSAPPASRRAWEYDQNFDASFDLDAAWIREALAPFDASREELGTSGVLVEHSSLYFLDFFFPATAGPDASEAAADDIVAGYGHGRYVSYNGQAVEIRKSKRDRAVPDLPNWYMIPITIEVRANTRTPV